MLRIPARRLAAFVVVLATLAALAPSPAAAVSYPRSIASTGDSITRAYNTGWLPYTDNPAGSWSTGTDSQVQSHYLRLLALAPRIRGNNYNGARSGAKMRDLAGQMATAARQNAEYVTVLMGGNDVCTSTESGMTSVSDFRAQFADAMATITSQDPKARVFVSSIPDVYRLWELFKDDWVARTAWDAFDVCQSLLADPLSTDADDVARRTNVRNRVIAFNAVLAELCAGYAKCRFDGNAVYNTDFTTSDVSHRDYFHPSLSGQAKLARTTWNQSFWAG